MSLELELPTTKVSGGGCGSCGNCACSRNPDSKAEPQAGAHDASALTPATQLPKVDAQSPLLDAPEHVLSTLEKDGSRRWLRPKLSQGSLWKLRRALAYVLMVIFVIVPHLRIGGRPVIQLDILAREFTILGHTFLPTDTVLLAFLMLGAFVGIVFTTTVFGRAWCGWACPQTVYIEFLFRPIDRLFDGTFGKGGKPKRPFSSPLRIIHFLLYVALTSVLAHTFLAYFVGTENLAKWLLASPLEHPVAFVVMAVTTGLLTYDFYFFREQTCMIACPYGRFQSVMLDRQSLIVAYDRNRGEPRKKGKREPREVVTLAENENASATVPTPNASAGDCVDCNQCVVVCPTGIDIRDGLQMECINCTQCIDACDSVMEKVGLPKGLVRFTSQDGLEGKKWKYWRPRTILYPTILCALAVGFIAVASTKYAFDARIIRGKGAPFTLHSNRQVTNSFHLRLVNRSADTAQYRIEVSNPDATLEVIDDEKLSLEEGDTALVPIQIAFPATLTQGDGNEPLTLMVVDSSDRRRTVKFKLLGPR